MNVKIGGKVRVGGGPKAGSSARRARQHQGGPLRNGVLLLPPRTSSSCCPPPTFPPTGLHRVPGRMRHHQHNRLRLVERVVSGVGPCGGAHGDAQAQASGGGVLAGRHMASVAGLARALQSALRSNHCPPFLTCSSPLPFSFILQVRVLPAHPAVGGGVRTRARPLPHQAGRSGSRAAQHFVCYPRPLPPPPSCPVTTSPPLPSPLPQIFLCMVSVVMMVAADRSHVVISTWDGALQISAQVCMAGQVRDQEGKAVGGNGSGCCLQPLTASRGRQSQNLADILSKCLTHIRTHRAGSSQVITLCCNLIMASSRVWALGLGTTVALAGQGSLVLPALAGHLPLLHALLLPLRNPALPPGPCIAAFALWRRAQRDALGARRRLRRRHGQQGCRHRAAHLCDRPADVRVSRRLGA